MEQDTKQEQPKDRYELLQDIYKKPAGTILSFPVGTQKMAYIDKDGVPKVMRLDNKFFFRKIED